MKKDELIKQHEEANEFIIGIANMLKMDTDNVGFDGIQFSLDDFQEAIQDLSTLKSEVVSEEDLQNLLQEPKVRDEKGMEFFLSDGNMLPSGDMTSFLYGAKKYHDYLQLKIDKLLSTPLIQEVESPQEVVDNLQRVHDEKFKDQPKKEEDSRCSCFDTTCNQYLKGCICKIDDVDCEDRIPII